ncbi:MAG: hypothetical protein JWM57_947 [Phycisphaerales bacterium]|nr:hypothetical protein [Phycisphaerales bacterium]
MPSLRFILTSTCLVAGLYLLCTAAYVRGAVSPNRFDQPTAIRALMAKAMEDTPPEVQKQIGDELAKEMAREMKCPASYFQ